MLWLFTRRAWKEGWGLYPRLPRGGDMAIEWRGTEQPWSPQWPLWDAWRENGEWFLQIGRLDIIIAPPATMRSARR
jgi:hypothetical protein